MTNTVEIYFRDLIPEAQQRVLDAFETNEQDENWDVLPIMVLEREVELTRG